MVDLDLFKRINDDHGHLVGDDCLRFSAHSLGAGLRAHDALVARFGGEEFVVGLPGKDQAAAVRIADELRRSLQESPCVSAGVEIHLSASFGVCQLRLDQDKSVSTALQLADEALYLAKADGRNCVRCGEHRPAADT